MYYIQNSWKNLVSHDVFYGNDEYLCDFVYRHTHTHANFPEQNHIMRVFVCCGGTHKTEKRVRFCLSYFNINVNKFG